MQVIVKQGDVLDEEVDVLICTANPMLRMTGGVNGALLQRGGEAVAQELRDFLQRTGKPAVERGSVVRTGPGPLKVNHLLHAVGVNIFYESSVEIVRALLEVSLSTAADLGAKVVATPALATGYGPLTITEFASALMQARKDQPGIEELRVVFRSREQADEVSRILGLS